MPLLPLSDARALISSVVRPVDPVALPLFAAHRRVLREDIFAPEDQPAFDRSAMDGYAIVANDPAERFRVVAEVQAGSRGEVTISAGECARIFTGAPIPRGATQVVMQEDVEREGEWVTVRQRDAKTWIRCRGEDARQGDRLLSEGTRLEAGELSLLAQIGQMFPRVSPPVRVLHFATGDELVDPAAKPEEGQIRDSNSTLIAALLAERGAHRVAQGLAGDHLDEAVALFESHPESDWDVLLISGGASVGDYDYGTRALERMGFTIHFRQLNLRPGKPLVFATRGRQVAFVIPGNPVSHFVTFHLAIRLALECLEGASSSWAMANVELAEDLPAKPDPRETWWPARVVISGGKLQAYPRAWQSSGDQGGLISTNGLLRVAPGAGAEKAGTIRECLLLAWTGSTEAPGAGSVSA